MDGRVDGSGIENPDSKGLEHLFNYVLQQDIDARYLSGTTYTINAFPLTVKKTEMPGKTLYQIVDSNTKAGVTPLDVEVVVDAKGVPDKAAYDSAAKVVKYVNDRVLAEFNGTYANAGTYRTEYNKEKNRWDVKLVNPTDNFDLANAAAIEEITLKTSSPASTL